MCMDFFMRKQNWISERCAQGINTSTLVSLGAIFVHFEPTDQVKFE